MLRRFLGLAGLLAAIGLAAPSSAAEVKRGYLDIGGGVEIHYREAGAGRTLLFVPGWTFSSAIFEHQLSGLSDRYRVVAIDPRGQGKSSKLLQGADYETHAADLAKVIAALALEDVALIGWSFGCLETYGYVRQAGLDNLSAHVCIDLPPKPLSASSEDWVEGPLDEIAGAYHPFLRDQKGQRDFITWYADEVMVQRELSPEEMHAIVDQSIETSHAVAAALFASGMFSNNLPEAKLLDEQQVPALNVVAEHWAASAKAYLAREVPGSKVEVLGGHMMFWEYPEQFNALLAAFLDGKS